MRKHDERTFESAVRPTPRQAGVELTIKVVAYDNGLVKVNTDAEARPINKKRADGSYDAGHGWLGAASYVTLLMEDLREEAAKRQQERAGKFVWQPGDIEWLEKPSDEEA